MKLSARDCLCPQLALTLESEINRERKSRWTIIFSQNVDDSTPCLLISVVALEKSVDSIVMIPLETVSLCSFHNLFFDSGVLFFSFTMTC